LSWETKLALYLLHASTVVLVRVVGRRRRMCLAGLAVIRSIGVAVGSWLAVVCSRARRLRRSRLIVCCARCSRLVPLAAFEGETESTVLVDVRVAAFEWRLILV
jgi:hypothetical protein